MTTYVFGRCSIDQACRELRCDQQSVTVQPRVFDLLFYLIEQRDRAVNKDELQDVVWGTIVTEDALTRAIMKARRVVGDNANDQQVIRTIHGHGYRFIAPVEAQAITVEPGSEKLTETSGLLSVKRWWAWAGVVGIVVATLLVTLFQSSPLEADAGIGVAVLPITNTNNDPELAWAEHGLMQLSSRIIDALPGLDTVSSRTIIQALPDEQLSSPNSVRIATVAEGISQRLGTQAFVAGNLRKQADTYIIDYLLEYDNTNYSGQVKADQASVAAEHLATAVARRILGTPIQNSPKVRALTGNPWINELYARGMAKQLAGDTEGAKTLFKAALDEDSSYFWPAYEYALSLRDTGDRQEAIDRLHNLGNQPGIDAEQLMSVHNALGIAYWRERNFELAAEHYKNGLAAAEQAGDLLGSASLLTNLGILARNQQQHDQARQYIERALLVIERAGAQQGSPYHSLAQIERVLGNINAAQRNYARAAEIFAANGSFRSQSISLRMLGRMTARLGDMKNALNYLQQSHNVAETVNAATEIERAVIYRAWVLDLMEQNQTAPELDNIKATTATDSVASAEAAETAASVSLRAGNFIQARQDANIARSVYIEHEDDVGLLSVNIILAEITAEEGDLDFAAREFEQLINAAQTSNYLFEEIKARLALGELNLQRGDLEKAIELLVSARKMTVNNGDRTLEWQIAPSLGSAYLKQGNIEAATAMAGVVSTAEISTLSGNRFLAQHAFAEGNARTALDLLRHSRDQYQSAWTIEDEAFLNECEQSLDTPVTNVGDI